MRLSDHLQPNAKRRKEPYINRPAQVLRMSPMGAKRTNPAKFTDNSKRPNAR